LSPIRITLKKLSAAATSTLKSAPPPELGTGGAARELGVLAEDGLDGLAERHGLAPLVGCGFTLEALHQQAKRDGSGCDARGATSGS
jgi:hypothetical protein